MKKNLKTKLIALICCLTAAFSVGGMVACDEKPGDVPPGPQTPSEPVQLSIPALVRNGNVASWEEVPGATKYKYKINGGEEQETVGRSITLSLGDTFQVMAVGDGVDYLDSAWSSVIRYVMHDLARPVVTLNGDVASWTAVPNASGYKYTVNGVEKTTNGTSVTLENGQTIRVVAVGDGVSYKDSLPSFPVTYSAYILTVTQDLPNAGVVYGAGAYKAGETADLTVTPNEGYLFLGWYIGGVCVATSPSYTVEDINASITVETRWQKKSYTISAVKNGEGVVAGGGNYLYGDSVTLTAQAATGHTFVGWYDGTNKVSSDATYVFAATASKTLTAKFEINQYTVSVSAQEGGNVWGGQKYNHGETVTVEALAKVGYVFDGWYENNQKVVGAGEIYTFTATANRTLVAKFVVRTYTLSVSAGVGGTVSGGDKVMEIAHGEEVAVLAIPSTGYNFAGWYEGTTKVWDRADYPFTMLSDRNLIAKFVSDVCTVDLTATEGGRVDGAGEYNYGSQITVRAISNTGYTFEGWFEGNTKVAISLVYTFTVTNHMQLEARWTINSYTLTLNTNLDGVGTVSGGGKYTYGQSGTVIATTTNSDYVFAGWYEGTTKVSSNASYTLTITSNRTLTATWELRACVLTLATDFDIAGTLTGDGSYKFKDSVQLKATAGTNYTFLGWYDGDQLLSDSPSFLYQITEDVTITAHWQDDWKKLEGYAYYTMKQHGNDVMPIVGFNSPNAATSEMGRTDNLPSQITDANYRILQESGVNTIVGWWNDWTNGKLQDDILRELDLADKYGISYIVNNRDALYLTSASQVNTHAAYMSKPAYGGTILIDEPGAVNFNDIAKATRAWEQSSYSDTMAYVNMLPNYAADWQLDNCQGTQGATYTGPAYKGYEEWIQRYLSIVKPEVFSYDHYPYLFTQPSFFRDGWYTNLSNVRYWTAKAGVPYWVYGQLGGWPEYGQVIDSSTKHLTFGHTALQFNSMLSYGAKGIQYYNYFMPPNYTNAKDYTSATLADGSPTPFYAQIQRINKQVAAVDDVLLRCAWKGIIPLNSSPAPIPDGDKLSSYAALVSASASGDAIVGCFEYRDIGWAYYVTTNNVYNASTVTLNFNGSYKLRKVQDGVSSETTSNKITLSIPAGDGVLVVVPKN